MHTIYSSVSISSLLFFLTQISSLFCLSQAVNKYIKIVGKFSVKKEMHVYMVEPRISDAYYSSK
jgi:hypothetical protein